MKKTIKIIAIIIAVLLILALLFVANALVGNPISKYLVDKNSDRYIKEQYPDLNLVKEIAFDFKSTTYYVKLKSETVEDLHFSLYYSLTGKMIRDLYENNIENGWNVLYRLDEDYRNETDIIFDYLKTEELFKETDLFYASAHLMSKIETQDRLVGFKDVEGGIDGTTLELDKDYDTAQMGKTGGVIDISLRFLDKDESYERGAQALKKIKEVFDEKNMGFYYINFAIFNEEGNFAYGFNFFPYSEIDKDDLAEKIEVICKNNPIPYDK